MVQRLGTIRAGALLSEPKSGIDRFALAKGGGRWRRVAKEDRVEGAGVYAPSFGETSCSARPLPITQRADDIQAEAQ